MTHFNIKPFTETADVKTYVFTADPVSASPPPARRQTAPGRLRIFHINDLHGHVCRPHGRRMKPTFAQLIQPLSAARRTTAANKHGGVLFLSAGDDSSGSIFDEELEENQNHIGYRLCSAAGLHAAAVGNHDLDLGAEALAIAIRRHARFPILSANLETGGPLRQCIHPAALLITGGMRVGIIGLTTPAQIKADEHTVRITNPLTAVDEILPAVKDAADIVIILSHLGRSLHDHSAAVQTAGDVQLAHHLNAGDVHLIIGGHTHHALNENGLTVDNIVNHTPIVQAGKLGYFLGEVTITHNGRTCVTDARLHLTSDQPVDESFAAQHITPLVEAIRPQLNRPLGPQPIHQPDFTTEAVRNDFASRESAFANLITDGLVIQCRLHDIPVDFAMIDRSTINHGLPTGTAVTARDWLRVMPYADTIRTAEINGRQLLALLHDNAHRADQPGRAHTERGFLHFSRALRYTIRTTDKHPASPTQITVNGIPLELALDRTFRIAYPSFLRQLAAPWEDAVQKKHVLPLVDVTARPYVDTGLFVRRQLFTYLSRKKHILNGDGRLHITAETDMLPIRPSISFSPFPN